MAKITEAEWQALGENFDTISLRQTVDAVDMLRTHLSDREEYRSPEIRDRLLKLHQLATDVINEGRKDKAQALFDLAVELEDEVHDMMEALTEIQGTITNLTAQYPPSLIDDSEGDPDDDEAA